MSKLIRGMQPLTSFNSIATAIALGVVATPALADDTFTYDGYLRQEMSWNMKNWEDTPGYNDRGKLSMMRSTARLNLQWKPSDDLSFVAKLRGVREVETSFLKHLEKMGANNYHEADGRGDITDLYDKTEIRELYVDLPLGERTRQIGRAHV